MILLEALIRMGRRMRAAYYTARVRRRAAACGPSLRVNGRSQVTGNTRLGTNVNFNGLEIVGAGAVKIGDNFHSGPGCLLIAQNHNFEGEALPYDSTVIALAITIEDNVWLGSRVIVLGGVTIGEGAIIQAGSTVVNDIPRCSIAGGHPATVFKSRDVEHYERLKRERKFH